MEAITVEMVCEAAAKALGAKKLNSALGRQITQYAIRNTHDELFVDPVYKNGLEQLGLTSMEAIFSFHAGRNLAKANLASHRSRIELQIESPQTTLFLKRYEHPPVLAQLKNWLSAKKRVSCGFAEFDAARKLAAMGINTPRVVAWGQQWGRVFEKRSFVMMEEVPEGESLERRLPGFFDPSAVSSGPNCGPETPENLKMRRRFVEQLAAFVRKFHDTGYRHRDLYLCHVFRTADGRFFLIDLARVFKPMLLGALYRVKDVAQLHYSAPAKYVSRTDRLRFLRAYLGGDKLDNRDRAFARRINNKAKRMALHDVKHGRAVPFAIRDDYNTAG
jgi:hypothetical protein